MAEETKLNKVAEKPAKKNTESKLKIFWKKVKNFFRDYKSEMKKIVWFSREDTVKNTAVVLVMMVISGAAVALFDFGFAQLILLLGRLF